MSRWAGQNAIITLTRLGSPTFPALTQVDALRESIRVALAFEQRILIELDVVHVGGVPAVRGLDRSVSTREARSSLVIPFADHRWRLETLFSRHDADPRYRPDRSTPADLYAPSLSGPLVAVAADGRKFDAPGSVLAQARAWQAQVIPTVTVDPPGPPYAPQGSRPALGPLLKTVLAAAHADNTHDFAAFIDLALTVRKARPDYDQLNLRLASRLLEANHASDALQLLEQHLSSNSGDLEARAMRARALVALGLFEHAAPAVEQVLGLDPSNLTARLVRAELRYRVGDTPGSLQDAKLCPPETVARLLSLIAEATCGWNRN